MYHKVLHENCLMYVLLCVIIRYMEISMYLAMSLIARLQGTWKFPCTSVQRSLWQGTWKFPCTLPEVSLQGTWKFPCTLQRSLWQGTRKFPCTLQRNFWQGAWKFPCHKWKFPCHKSRCKVHGNFHVPCGKVH